MTHGPEPVLSRGQLRSQQTVSPSSDWDTTQTPTPTLPEAEVTLRTASLAPEPPQPSAIAEAGGSARPAPADVTPRPAHVTPAAPPPGRRGACSPPHTDTRTLTPRHTDVRAPASLLRGAPPLVAPRQTEPGKALARGRSRTFPRAGEGEQPVLCPSPEPGGRDRARVRRRGPLPLALPLVRSDASPLGTGAPERAGDRSLHSLPRRRGPRQHHLRPGPGCTLPRPPTGRLATRGPGQRRNKCSLL